MENMASSSNDKAEEDIENLLANLFDPRAFLSSLEGEIPEDILAELYSELKDVIDLPKFPTRKPPGDDLDQLGERFDVVLDGIRSYFPEGLPDELTQVGKSVEDEKAVAKLDLKTTKFYEKDLKIAETLGNHPLCTFLNSTATDGGNLIPKGRSPHKNPKDTEPASYKYLPLDYSTDASRVVILHPGNRNDELKCELVTLPLSILENPDDKSTALSCYEALSYVWGSPVDPILIEIDGQDFPIGRNLYSALMHLRDEDEKRLLWIDAICINQNDIPERNWQVSRMGLIYRSALRTVAWLGTATWGSDMICACILAFQAARQGDTHLLSQEEQNVTTSLFGSKEIDDFHFKADPGFIHALWDQLDQLLERPLFSRSWVVQEIVLGREVIIHCGNISFPYSTLEFAMAESGIVRQALGIHMYTPLKTGLAKLSSFSILRLELRETEKEIPLFKFASRFGRLLATDPRDKIFAFLSLSPALIHQGVLLDHGFSPDYGKTTLDVYRDFTTFCIAKYNNLDILSRPFRNNSKEPSNFDKWLEGWPSWVPDWDRRGIKEHDFGGLDSLGQSPFREFNVAGWWEDVVMAEVDGRTIAFGGVAFDEVLAVVEGDVFVDPGNFGGREEHWNVWERFAMDVGKSYGETESEKQEAFWRTMVADSNDNGSFAPEEFGAMFKLWRSNTPPDNPSPKESELYESFTTQLYTAAGGRKLFTTKRGYLGLGSWEIKRGDSISILSGGSLPIIGRATGMTMGEVIEENGVEVGVKKVAIYKIVGSGGTYIHGIMDGEGVGIVEEEDGFEGGGVFFC